jgi:hypothetical protein
MHYSPELHNGRIGISSLWQNLFVANSQQPIASHEPRTQNLKLTT